MTRIAVIGNAGGGKSTICRELSRTLDIPLYPIDRIQWKPGWVRAPYEEIKQQHDEILTNDRWIIDGWGPFDIIEERFAAADTIIFVDLPLYVHYWWSIKRQIACLFRPRADVPEGCPMLPMTWPLLKMIWNIHYDTRPRLLESINAHRGHKRIFHLRSPRELHQFMRTYCA